MNRTLRGFPRGLLLLGLAVVLFASLAQARIGGGDTFGGGEDDSDSSGGGGDGAEWVVWAVSLAIHNPEAGIPVLVIIGLVWFFRRRARKREGTHRSLQREVDRRASRAERRRLTLPESLRALRVDDPGFSEILFLDFAQLLFTRYHESRGSGAVEALRPYLADDLRSKLEAAKGTAKVRDVIVGSVLIDEIQPSGQEFRVSCEIEANYTEQDTAYYSRGLLTFRRDRGVHSKGPTEMRTLGCPSCGSPIQQDLKGVCAYCSQAVRPGLFHWELEAIDEVERKRRIEMPLDAGGGVEHGTDLPTIYDPALAQRMQEFAARNPGDFMQRLIGKAKEVFLALQQAWTTGQFEQARVYETDRLFQMHLFWMARYREKKLQNVLDQVQILGTTVVKLDRDAFFDIATLRIKASMLDYLLDAGGKTVGGSREKPRVFSEYWTFVHRGGAADADGGMKTGTCPSCGAPAKVSMYGRCEFCDANLAGTEFDWTLAKIEQDETYMG